MADDVIPEILAKLPVKSLLRFKSVCEKWYSIISDPQFCNEFHCMRPSALICHNSERFSTITIESLLTAKNKTPTPLSLPWETEAPRPRLAVRGGNYLIGSCNGLVCVDHKSGGEDDDLILWNPSTRKFRRLPRRSRVPNDKSYKHFVWFGYDESIHDYKLVWVDYHRHDPGETKLHVFTLKSNAWSRTDDCRLSKRLLMKEDDQHNPRIIGVLSNKAVHWRAYSVINRRTVILALDLAAENFQVLDFANYPFDPQRGGSCLVGGCSCMYDSYGYDTPGFGGMSLQIIKKYGLGERAGGVGKYYRILFSSGKEILAVFDGFCQTHRGITYDDRIIKFRIEEGGEKVSTPETLLDVRDGYPFRNNIILHMEESFESLIKRADIRSSLVPKCL